MPVPVQLDRRLISDPSLSPIADKVERGERLSAADGVALFDSGDLLGIGHMADAVNRAQARRPRDVRGEPAHQSDEHLHAAEDVRLLLVRAAAQGRGRVSLHDGAGVGRSRDARTAR